MPITELENDSESVWLKMFANKTSYFVASWYRLGPKILCPRYRPPGGDLENLESQLASFESQLDKIKDIINLYFTKFAVICLSPSTSPSNQHINGCFILTENWYALPMVFFLLLGTPNKMTRYHILKYLGPKECQSTCSYLFWSRNI